MNQTKEEFGTKIWIRLSFPKLATHVLQLDWVQNDSLLIISTLNTVPPHLRILRSRLSLPQVDRISETPHLTQWHKCVMIRGFVVWQNSAGTLLASGRSQTMQFCKVHFAGGETFIKKIFGTVFVVDQGAKHSLGDPRPHPCVEERRDENKGAKNPTALAWQDNEEEEEDTGKLHSPSASFKSCRAGKGLPTPRWRGIVQRAASDCRLWSKHGAGRRVTAF